MIIFFDNSEKQFDFGYFVAWSHVAFRFPLPAHSRLSVLYLRWSFLLSVADLGSGPGLGLRNDRRGGRARRVSVAKPVPRT